MKCDEARPECGNCIKTNRQCYYVPPPKDIFVIQNLAPKLKEPLTVPCSPPSGLFGSEEELRYFEIFRRETASNISGHFNSALWNRTILQTCERNRALLGCVVAIGALDETMRVRRRYLRSEMPNMSEILETQSAHHAYALKQYGRAIKQIKISLQQQPDMRTAIIACLLTVVFESLHGDITAAVTLVRSGLRLIRDYSPTHLSAVEDRLGGVDDLHEVLQLFDRMDNDCVVAQE